MDQPTTTLNEALAARGYTTAPGRLNAKRILRDGREVFHGTADEVWAWLREVSRGA